MDVGVIQKLQLETKIVNMPKLVSFNPEIHKKQNIEGYETIVFLSFLYEFAITLDL